MIHSSEKDACFLQTKTSNRYFKTLCEMMKFCIEAATFWGEKRGCFISNRYNLNQVMWKKSQKKGHSTIKPNPWHPIV